jgi:hypothetical protein
LIEWQNGQLHDVSGRSHSPYLQDTTFAFTLLQEKAEGLSLDFILPSDLLFSNLEENLDLIEIDFDDGRGFRTITPDKEVAIAYTRKGNKTIHLQYHMNGQIYKAISSLEVEEKPEIVNARDRADYERSFTTALSGMDLTIFPACEEEDAKTYKLRRLFIVLEGFGGNFTTSSEMFDYLDENISVPTNQTLREFLNENEYDLIWIDYGAGFEYAGVETNADFLIEALDWINDRKHEDGSSEPNVFLGVSMGGLVGKAALLKMHNLQNKDSEVERFMSLDTPFKGANFPIGIQAFIRDMVYQIDYLGESVDQFATALGLLDSPASKDLLMAGVAFDGSNFSITTGPFDAIQTKIAGWEAILPFNAITRHVALSNGASNGTLQESFLPFPEGQILSLDLEASIFGICVDVKIIANAYSATALSTGVYYHDIIIEDSWPCNGQSYLPEIDDVVTFIVPAPLAL